MRIDKYILAAVCVILLGGCVSQTNSGWGEIDKILSRVKAPQFPAKDFMITDYGAAEIGRAHV